MRKLLLMLVALVFMTSSASAYTALQQSITGNGMNQNDLVTLLGNIRDLENELQDDHATFRTVVADNKALVNQLRYSHLYNVLGNPGYIISSNFDAKNATAVYYSNLGTLKTLAANTNCDTGTTMAITTVKWAVGLLSIDASGTCVVTWSALGTYTSEALAIAAMPALPATSTAIGYITVLAAGVTWTAGTDALAGGSGGTAATTTNYYNNINPNTLMVGAAVSTSAPAALTASTAISLTP